MKGQSDFYGLGIRCGIYLQWISSWMSLLVDRQSAQSIFATNSIFVFAITIATLMANFADGQTMKPIETYIMLQFMLGFFATTLSTVGVRLAFLRPGGVGRSLKSVMDSSCNSWKEIKGKKSFGWWKRSQKTGQYWENAKRLATVGFSWPLHVLLKQKPYNLSWSGVIWRTGTATIIAGLNLWYWFIHIDRVPEENHPVIFLLGKQELRSGILTVSQAFAVIIAVLVFIPSFFVLYFMIHLCLVIVQVMGKSIFVNSGRQGYSKSEAAQARLNSWLRRRRMPLSKSRGFLDFMEFFSASRDQICCSDILRLMVALEDAELEADDTQRPRREPTVGASQSDNRHWKNPFWYLWNIYIILNISWFIISVEFAISWNDIQDVNSIQKTDPGQLIPFIIGCVNTAQVLKKVALKGLAKVCPYVAAVL
ncbi:hypothetical protein AK830_g3504 [Neonectria ditissima]|uniref:Uncharacterized protein n=1 Tax=Neonectria ditissima TaxID=78410 RepID=A0A0N8H7Y2_9HYPO|nr:hypothetical protein AK830_g3504 [Neonectria ditissima]